MGKFVIIVMSVSGKCPFGNGKAPTDKLNYFKFKLNEMQD